MLSIGEQGVPSVTRYEKISTKIDSSRKRHTKTLTFLSTNEHAASLSDAKVNSPSAIICSLVNPICIQKEYLPLVLGLSTTTFSVILARLAVGQAFSNVHFVYLSETHTGAKRSLHKVTATWLGTNNTYHKLIKVLPMPLCQMFVIVRVYDGRCTKKPTFVVTVSRLFEWQVANSVRLNLARPICGKSWKVNDAYAWMSGTLCESLLMRPHYTFSRVIVVVVVVLFVLVWSICNADKNILTSQSYVMVTTNKLLLYDNTWGLTMQLIMTSAVYFEAVR